MKYCENDAYKEGRLNGCTQNSRRNPRRKIEANPANYAEYTRGFNEGRSALAAERDRVSKAKKRARARAKR